MAFSQSLADRVRHALRDHRGITEKTTFGSLCFLLSRNLLVGIWQSSLIVRLGPEQAAPALQQEHVREFDVTGRPMNGLIMSSRPAWKAMGELAKWTERAVEFVETLAQK